MSVRPKSNKRRRSNIRRLKPYRGHRDDIARGVKRCPVCEIKKPFREFYADKNKPGGCGSLCRPCQRAATAKYRASKYGAAKERRYVKSKAFKEAQAKYLATGRATQLGHCRRAVQRALISLSPDAWQFTLIAFEGKCVYCGISDRLEQDHVTPISKGGLHTVGNVVPACKSCNSRKGAKDPRAWHPAPDRLRRKLRKIRRDWNKQQQINR